MAPIRRARRGRSRWLRVQYVRQPGNVEMTIAGERTRKVYDSYCPYCATDIRALAPRRLGIVFLKPLCLLGFLIKIIIDSSSLS
jgi:hypothetical protein